MGQQNDLAGTCISGNLQQAAPARTILRNACAGLVRVHTVVFGPFQEETRVFEALPDIQIPSMLRGVFQTGYRAPFRAVFDTDLCIHHGVLIYPERGDCL